MQFPYKLIFVWLKRQKAQSAEQQQQQNVETQKRWYENTRPRDNTKAHEKCNE